MAKSQDSRPIANLIDFPGINGKFFSLNGDEDTGMRPYVEHFGLRHADIIIAVTSHRFTDGMSEIIKEVLEYNVPTIVARTKIDNTIDNVVLDGSFRFHTRGA